MREAFIWLMIIELLCEKEIEGKKKKETIGLSINYIYMMDN